MRRLLCGLCALGLLVLASQADDAKLTAASKAFKVMEKEFLDKINDKTLAAKDRTELLDSSAKKFFEHAQKNARDDSAFDALVYVLRMTRPSKDKDDIGNKALATLKQGHLKNKKITSALGALFQRDQDASALVQQIVAQNPDRKVQVKTLKTLKMYREQMGQMAQRLKENEKLKEQFEKIRGKEYVQELLDNAEKHAAEIKSLDKTIKEKYAGLFPDLSIGKAAPEVISQDLDGKKVKLSDLKGKVVVLDIWATWCGPCIKMIPHTRKLVEKMKDKPFVFVSVSADAKKETLEAFVKKTPMPWTHWWEGTSGMIEEWEVQYFPTIYILDHKGIIRFKDLREARMDEAVEKLIKEAEDEKKS